MELRRLTPQRYIARNDYRALWIPGGVMIAIGLWSLGSGLDWLPPAGENQFDKMVAGIALAVFGFGLATWRRGLLLNLDRGRAWRWNVVLGCRFSSSVRLDQVDKVRLAARHVRSRNVGATAYFIELLRPGHPDFELGRVMEPEQARELARQIAAVLELPLEET